MLVHHNAAAYIQVVHAFHSVNRIDYQYYAIQRSPLDVCCNVKCWEMIWASGVVIGDNVRHDRLQQDADIGWRACYPHDTCKFFMESHSAFSSAFPRFSNDSKYTTNALLLRNSVRAHGGLHPPVCHWQEGVLAQ